MSQPESLSVSLDLTLELLGEVGVGAEGSILGLLLESRVPAVELVEAVAEADALTQGHVRNVTASAALSVAAVMKVLEQGEVLLNEGLVLVLHAHIGRFSLLFINIVKWLAQSDSMTYPLLDGEIAEALVALSRRLVVRILGLLGERSDAQSLLVEELLHVGVRLCHCVYNNLKMYYKN